MKIGRLVTVASALAALAGGVVCAKAQQGASGPLTANFVFSNAPVWEVFGIAQLNVSFNGVNISLSDYDVDTDGNGKITGFATLVLDLPDAAETANVVVSVSGTITTKGSTPTVKMNLKGNGVTINNSSAGKANLSLSFTGTPADSGQITGTANASFKTGIKGDPTFKVSNVSAFISSGDVENSTDLPVNTQLAAFKGSVNAAGRLVVGGGSQLPVTGTGNAGGSKGNFNLQLKGIEWGKGSNLKLKGTVDPNGDVTDPASWTALSANGKIEGQKVSSSNASIDVTEGWITD